MSNQIQFLRSTTPSAAPPATVAPGEPVAILDQVGKVDLYVGDSAGTPVLVNPATTPIGGLTFEYRWNADTTLATAPALGDVKLDGIQTTVVGGTTLSVHETTAPGGDSTPLWAHIKNKDFLVLFEQGGSGGAGGETFTFQASGPAVDMGLYWNIPGAVFRDSGNAIDDNRTTTLNWVQHPDNINTTRGNMVWTNTWPGPATPYTTFDVARDGDFSMVANVATTDRPAPQPSGLPTNDRPGAAAWTYPTNNAVNESGVELTFTLAGVMTLIEAWLPPTGGAKIYAMTITTNGTATRYELNTVGVPEDVWVSVVAGSKFYAAGDVVEIVLETTDGREYVEEVAAVSAPAWATAKGVLRYAGVDQVGDANGYGVRVTFQPYAASADWDFLSYSGSLSPAGGGSDPVVVLDYDAAAVYEVNHLVMEAGYMYRANIDIAVPEAFDPTKWDATTPLDMGTFV